MRYQIRPSRRYLQQGTLLRLSNGDMPVLTSNFVTFQQRGQVLAFLFALSFLTTLLTLIHFHWDTGGGGGPLGVLSFEYASKVLLIDDTGGQRGQTIRFLRKRYDAATKRLRWSYLHRGRRIGGGGGESDMEGAPGARMSAIRGNQSGSGVQKVMEVEDVHLATFLHEFLPPSRNGGGLYVEYYGCGSNVSISSTLQLERKYNWRGVAIYGGKAKVDDNLRGERSSSSFVGAGFRICDVRQAPGLREETKKLEGVPSTVNDNLVKTSVVSEQAQVSLSPSPAAATNLKRDDDSQGFHCLEGPCFSPFSVVNVFRMADIDFLVIHTARQDVSEVETLLKALFSHGSVLRIRAMSIIQSPISSSSPPMAELELEKLKESLAKREYQYQTLPLGHSPRLNAIRNGTMKVHGQLDKNAELELGYQKMWKQHLFLMKNIAGPGLGPVNLNPYVPTPSIFE